MTWLPPAALAKVYAPGGEPAKFDTEAAEQCHCPRDVVVRLNIPTGIFHEKSIRWYVCRKEANAARDRDTAAVSSR